ncbi:MAG: hypothetical protein ACI398_05840 [Clostridium sp.]
MKTERIGLRFNKKDEDIISWFIMLNENGIEKSFAVKALLKAFFLNESINGGNIKIRHGIVLEPTSISINEPALNEDIMKIKSQGVKLASFTKDIIRSFICISEEDRPPQYSDLQKIHTKYKLKYLNSLIYNDSKSTNINSDINMNSNIFHLKSNSDKFNTNKAAKSVSDEIVEKEPKEKSFNNIKENEKEINKNNDNEMKKPKNKKKNPLLSQI